MRLCISRCGTGSSDAFGSRTGSATRRRCSRRRTRTEAKVKQDQHAATGSFAMRYLVFVLPVLALADYGRPADASARLPAPRQQGAATQAQSLVAITEWTVR